MTSKQEINNLQKNLRILKDWKFFVDSKSKYKGQICINSDTKIATIYNWPSKENIPEDFYFHEMLHAALVALKKTRGRAKYEAEEQLTQDICAIASNWFNAKHREMLIFDKKPYENKIVCAGRPHTWFYCQQCKTWAIKCGFCHNNCCNGGSGENCPDQCSEAYSLQDQWFSSNEFKKWVKSLDYKTREKKAIGEMSKLR